MNNIIYNFGKVAVLMGGISAERDVSMQSGMAVLQALQASNIDAEAIELTDIKLENIIQLQYFDKVFIALHGGYGENGSIQSMLSLLKIPYTGSGASACALAMDKLRTKIIWDAYGITTPNYIALSDTSYSINLSCKFGRFDNCAIDYIINNIQLPVVVKPNYEGSTVGLTKVYHPEDLEKAYQLARSCSDIVLVEKLIEGPEYTIAILNNQPLPIVQIKAPAGNYDYYYKYISDDTQYFCPSDLSEQQVEFINQQALLAFKLIGADTWARLDFMQDMHTGKFYFLEINTVPGLTNHSLVPMAAKKFGLDFNKLCIEILNCAKVK